MRDQTPIQMEEYYPPYDRWFENRIFPSPEGLSIYFLDITEKKKREEAQRQSEKLSAIGLLAGGIAHDFNNQLSIIIGYADLLAGRLKDPELRRFAESVQAAARSSGDLTKNLLTFSRRGHFESVPLDFHDLAAEVVGLVRHTLGKRIDIRCRFEAGRAVVAGDPAALQNALLNLSLNAHDAMPGGGTLEIATAEEEVAAGRDEGGQAGAGTGAAAGGGGAPAAEGAALAPGAYLRISVADTGIGMTEEVRRRIFEPFFTTKGSAVGASGRMGTGLGLASVFGTVKLHKGRITVVSAPDRGTTFHILLPLAPADARVEDGAFQASPPGPGSLTVLVAEDDPGLRDLVGTLLATDGHRVIPAGSGREALTLFAANRDRVDLVLLDMAMPDMDGVETFHALRKEDPGVRVLLTSGFSPEGRVQSLLEAGAAGHLQKPYEKSRLARLISQALKPSA
jgi:signal transduction histidine kinase/CheY-like chemotaxis protein